MSPYNSDSVPIEVPTIPHLESEGLAVFDRYVSGTSCYMEYGAGGSTLRAEQLHAAHIISVDSSHEWVLAVGSAMGFPPCLDLIHCDIGEVGAWGRPRNMRGLYNYHFYMSKPWEVARNKSLTPAVIMIDGRFRVSCFLYSLLCAKPGTIILFDDYAKRNHYHVVEAFCVPHQVCGRMAIFQVGIGYALPEIVARIAEYSIRFE
jgi:hypothetical protein